MTSSRLKSQLLYIATIAFFLFTLCLPYLSGASTYSYDEGNRLIRVKYDNGARIDYTYDESGNRIQSLAATPSIQVTVKSDAHTTLPGVKLYLFNEAGSYLGLTQVTNSSGVAVFEVSAGKYKVRADYMGYQFWSDVVSFPETVDVTILIPLMDVEVDVTKADGDAEGVKVYLFTAAGSYLGVYSVTDASGNVTFKLPVGGSYKVRSDIMGNQYWSNVLLVSGGGTNTLAVNAGGGILQTNILQGAGVPLTNIKTYLFSGSGSYLGFTQKSDAAGAVSFTVPQGTYKVRADYLGYQFWNGATAVSSNVTTDLLIAHKDVGIVINGAFQGTLTPLTSLNTYLFTSAGSYMSKTLKTDTTGKVVFSVPQKAYKVRSDYLGQQYWSEEFTWVDKVINVPMADAAITMAGAGMPQANLPVYVFSAAKSYLGITAKTNAEGKVTFRLPAGTYKFRADYQSGQFWSTDQTLTTDQSKDVTISTGGSNFNLTVKVNTNPLAGVQCYVFNDKSAYLGVSGATDDSGKVVFALSDGSYKFRVDYLGYQFWSGVMTVPTTLDLTMTIPMSTVVANVGAAYGTISNVTVSLFSESGSYLGVNAVTDAAGNVTFNLPAGCRYKLRYDILGNQYWSDVFAVAEGVQNNLTLNAGGGTLQVNILKAAGNPLTGVTAYLLNQNGTYLGSNQTADTAGKVTFSVPSGTYRVRVDYLSYQFWSGDCVVGSDLSTNLIIPHKDVTLTVGGLYQGSFTPIADVSTHLFNSTDSYMGKTIDTDTTGNVVFNLPEKAFKVRADYMSQQYWSDEFTWLDNLINIPMADAVITMTGAGMPRADVPVYVFSSGNSYLGVTGKTGSDGKVTFRIPAGTYKFRADYQTNQFWTDDQTIVADQVNYVNLSDGGGNFTLTVKANTDPLVGVTCYVFNDEGSYLGLTGVTNDHGQYAFELSTGNYKIRVDYLGYQFWTNVYSVPTQQAAEFAIELFDTPVTVNAFYRTLSPLSDLDVYLFTQAGAYLNIKKTTDSNGNVVFSIPNKNYKSRVDYLGRQFWANVVGGQTSRLEISEGLASVYAHTSAGPVAGATVSLFSESGSYLGMNVTTDIDGYADFTLPAYPFKFRVDVAGTQYWSDVINIIAGTQTVVDVSAE
jgi:YD repeat-containing protein